MDIASSEAVAEQYAQGIKSSVEGLSELHSVGRPEGDNAAFMGENDNSFSMVVQAGTRLQSGVMQFSDQLVQAAGALSTADSKIAGGM